MLTALIGGLLLLAPSQTSAQLFPVGPTINTLFPGGMPWRGVDVAHDPQRDMYLVITAYGPVLGRFTDANGQPVTDIFPIHTGSFSHLPILRYVPDLPNGAGGTGAFLVVWLDSAHGNSVAARAVSVVAPSSLASGLIWVSDPAQGAAYFENRPSVAYSRTSQRFLVSWTTPHFGVQGRLIDLNGAAVGGVIRFEEARSRDASVAWNPATDEFGLVNTGWGDAGAHVQFRRVRASDGAVLSRTTFGHTLGTHSTSIDVNPSNQYVVAWSLYPGTLTSVFDAAGNQLNSQLVSGRIGFDLSLDMEFNPTTNSLLAVSSDSASAEVAGVEISAAGQPISVTSVLTTGASESAASFYPMVAARTVANHWNVVRSTGFMGASNQIISTTGSGGGSDPAPPPPPPPPPPTGCTTPDPFVSLGGGTCVNGGWLPPSSPPPPPPPSDPPAPPPPSGGCTIPDPFVSIGGGICVNGGWIPNTGGAAPPPPSSPPPGDGTCSGADPFASVGGGVCQNGGWVPASMACVGPDPFVSIGGGICVNGGWVPRGTP